MKSYRVNYNHREADFGQAKRVWQQNFQIVQADSDNDAKDSFMKNWQSKSEIEIISIEKCGVQ